MQYKQLGDSGLFVADLALGTMLFGEEDGRGTPPDVATQMLERYLDMGGNHIDTANVYAGGRSEEIIGAALKSKRDRVVLATKVRFGDATSGGSAGLSRSAILRGVEASLQRLQTDYIDLYYMHGWDPYTPIGESLRAFDDLVTAGKVRYIGVSNFKAWQVMKALNLSSMNGWLRFVAAQYQYSLVQRDIEYEYIDLFASEGVGIVPWGPLGGGFLSGKYRRGERPAEGRIVATPDQQEEAWERRNNERNWNIIDAVGAIAEERGVSYAQIALAWLRAQPNVSSVIIGARTLEQFEDNIAAAELSLTNAELARLRTASRLPDLYPYRMMEAYGMTRSV